MTGNDVRGWAAIDGSGKSRGHLPRALLLVLALCPFGAAVGALALLGSASATEATANTDNQVTTPVHGELILTAVRCGAWRDVPGNATPEVPRDDTNGRYRNWGPADANTVVAPRPDELPAGCALTDGVGFGVSATLEGKGFSSTERAEVTDDHRTAVTSTVPGVTGRDGSGRLVTPLSWLSAAQRESLSTDVGLWVQASGFDAPDFANLRCHEDRFNADNLEVIRTDAVGGDLACVLYLVAAAAQTPIVVAPQTPDVVLPPVPVSSASDTPLIPPPAPAVVTPPGSPGQPTPVVAPDTAQPVAPAAAGPVVVLPPSELPITITPAPAPAPTAAAVPVNNGGDGTSASAERDVDDAAVTRAALVVPTAADLAVPRPPSSTAELKVRLLVTTSAGAASSSSTSRRKDNAVVVRYACGEDSRVLRVEVPSAELQSSMAASPGATCSVVVQSVGADLIADHKPSILVDFTPVEQGISVPVVLRAGEVRVVPVLVELDGPRSARLAEQSSAGDDGSPTPEATIDELAAAPAPATTGGLTTATAVGLGVVFLAGLGLSVVAARRPL